MEGSLADGERSLDVERLCAAHRPGAAVGEDGGPVEAGSGGPSAAQESRTPSQRMAVAVQRLNDAGTFAYTGTVRSDEPGMARPGIWQEGDLAVDGEVVLPDRSREVAVDASGRAVETVTENVVVWAREAHDAASLPEVPLRIVAELRGGSSVPVGAPRLAEILTCVGDRAAAGTDEEGRTRVRGTVRSGELITNDGTPLPTAEVVVTIDDGGDPVRIELATDGAGPQLVMALDIEQPGEPVTIDLPAGHPTSISGDVTPDEVRAAGIEHAVELGEIPHGWILYSTELIEPVEGFHEPECAELELRYADSSADAVDRYLSLEVTFIHCDVPDGDTSEPITLGPFTGADFGEDRTFARVSDGRVNVEVHTPLSVPEVSQLFESMEPFDPATRPVPAPPPTAT